jgi:hypothetical protein
MKGKLIILLMIIVSCSKKADTNRNWDNDSLKTDIVIKTDSSGILGKLTSPRLTILGDTISQRLVFEVSGNNFEFEVKYVIREPFNFTSFWQIDILEFKPVQCPSTFSKDMVSRLKENFWQFYRIPLKDFDDKIRPTISAADISEFFIVKDYNLDGVTDFGISDTPTGNNVYEDIYVNFNNNFFHWKGLSGLPIWTVNQNRRTITTGWHMSADIHSISEFTITNDTTLTEVSKEETEELNDRQIIRKTYKYSKLIKVDTVDRDLD